MRASTRLSAERGAQLVELGIAMLIASLVATVMLVWASAVGRTETLHRSNDDTMQELRLAKEQLSKDLRRAESFTLTAADQVTMWIDENRNSAVDSGENVSWHITSGGELDRIVDLTASRTDVTGLDVSQSLFQYEAPLPGVVENVSFTLVALVDDVGPVEERSVSATVHVRNA